VIPRCGWRISADGSCRHVWALSGCRGSHATICILWPLGQPCGTSRARRREHKSQQKVSQHMLPRKHPAGSQAEWPLATESSAEPWHQFRGEAFLRATELRSTTRSACLATSLMKYEEKIAVSFLKSYLRREPVYEPLGESTPPDFSIETTALEVRGWRIRADSGCRHVCDILGLSRAAMTRFACLGF
jgi:hypothetical protein